LEGIVVFFYPCRASQPAIGATCRPYGFREDMEKFSINSAATTCNPQLHSRQLVQSDTNIKGKKRVLYMHYQEIATSKTITQIPTAKLALKLDRLRSTV
jgi:hypothetical protein